MYLRHTKLKEVRVQKEKKREKRRKKGKRKKKKRKKSSLLGSGIWNLKQAVYQYILQYEYNTRILLSMETLSAKFQKNRRFHNLSLPCVDSWFSTMFPLRWTETVNRCFFSSIFYYIRCLIDISNEFIIKKISVTVTSFFSPWPVFWSWPAWS